MSRRILTSRNATILVSALILLKVAILFLLAWNRRIVMDEFAQLGWAKYLGNGLFDTIWPSKNAGFTVFIDLAHLIGWDARSILLIGRMETALLACGTLAIVYAIARALGQSRMRAALVVLILLSFSNFIERIFETRAEPLATFFGAAALLAAVRAGNRPWRIVGAGVISGLAFLSTQKAIYFDVALGVALVGDAVIRRRYVEGAARGAWLVVGWLAPIIIYCFVFGGSDPLPVAQNIVWGPLGVVSPQISAEYGGLRRYLIQTLSRNALLYVFCFAGMIAGLLRFNELDERRRIALVFSIVITALVFAHDQPWPYVFIMALPFMSLWALGPFDRVAGNKRLQIFASAVLAIAISFSFARNAMYLRSGNSAQLELVARAESLLGPRDVYFDGVSMIPNRPEPSTLWLDRHNVLRTLREKQNSEAYGIFAHSPPKLVLWSYRMDAIESVVAPVIDNSYVRVAPNIMIAGRLLEPGKPTMFNVPIAGSYRLYSDTGEPLQGSVEIDGLPLVPPIMLGKGPKSVTLRTGTHAALLVPEGAHAGRFKPGPDDASLFAGVYD